MKNLTAMLLCMAVCGSTLFAQDAPKPKPKPKSLFSAGVGAYFTSDFGGGVEVSASGISGEINTPYAGGGGFAFFDAKYAELSLGFFGGGGTMETKSNGENTNTDDFSVSGLDIGLLGKYPFAVGQKLSVFPLLGITYRVMLSATVDGEEYEGFGEAIVGKPEDFSALWFKFGGGLDYSFTEKIYLRGTFLYGLRIENKAEKDLKNMFETEAMDTKTLLGHGLEIKVAAGYRF
jgi:hypothetical protein